MLPALVLSDLPSHCTNPSKSSLYLSHLQKQGAEDYQGTEQAAQGWVSSYSATHCQDVCIPTVGPGWGPSQALPRNGRMMRGWWSSNGDIMRGTAPPVLLSSQGT